jgi:hypothetical protein
MRERRLSRAQAQQMVESYEEYMIGRHMMMFDNFSVEVKGYEPVSFGYSLPLQWTMPLHYLHPHNLHSENINPDPTLAALGYFAARLLLACCSLLAARC